MDDSIKHIERDIALVARIQSVPTILRVLCDLTGMGFSAVARVTDGSWTACAVLDEIGFGLVPGGQLDLDTTLCKEVRETRTPIVIGHASTDPVYCQHHTPRTYSIESYVSVPVVMPDGSYFGNLCAIDPRPAQVADPRIIATFVHFAALIAKQLESERREQLVHTALRDERSEGGFREQLLGILGHDLRAPVGAIQLAAQRLRGRAGDVEAVKALAAEISEHSKRASALIGKAEGLAQARLGARIAVEPVWVDSLGEALVGVVADMHASYPERDMRWSFDIHRPVRVDRARIQQLLTNLLSNALTHSAPASQIKVTAVSTPDELQLTVWNEGDTMPAERFGSEFLPDWQKDRPGRPEGIRMGLHICAEIAAAHGGRIHAEHSADLGTSFVVVLPA